MPASPRTPQLPAAAGPPLAAGGRGNPAPPPLCASAVQRGETASIALSGDLDIATVPLAASVLERAQLAACVWCVVDLRGLTFVDSSGVRLLTQLAASARAGDYALLIVPPVGGAAARMMQLHQMDQLLTYITAPPGPDSSPPRRACTAPGARIAKPSRPAGCRQIFEHAPQP